MIIGQILVYRYNGLDNAKVGAKRNRFTKIDIAHRDHFKPAIVFALDGIKPGTGYVLAKWAGKMFKCEKDLNNPEADYVRHEVNYHPLAKEFTI